VLPAGELARAADPWSSIPEWCCCSGRPIPIDDVNEHSERLDGFAGSGRNGWPGANLNEPDRAPGEPLRLQPVVGLTI